MNTSIASIVNTQFQDVLLIYHYIILCISSDTNTIKKETGAK
jgi:hypothetical protein